MTSSLLSVRNLTVEFATRDGVVPVIDDLSFDLAPGETLSLVGESGCGKTITALAVMGLIPSPPGRVAAGSISLAGEDLVQATGSRMREIRGNEISMVFQEPMTSLNPVLSIGLQLTETMQHHLGLSSAQALKRAAELLEMVGIAEPKRRLAQFPHHLSGGMRQRVMIAVALSCEPKLIIADEPTTALDVTIQAQILELMKDLTKRLGVALVVITHNLGVVARYADRVNVMYAGKIIEMGSAQQIYHQPHHPYTLGLLASVPRMDQPRGTRLIPIDGQPPDLTRLDGGCAFRPRCRFAVDRCAQEFPPLENIDSGHVSACWRVKEINELKNAS